ncbi:hypothetical protein GCM10029978_023640 [Actinoallomurus acanthiterrae]
MITAVVAVVLIAVGAGAYAVFRAIPDIRTAFLVDASASASGAGHGGFGAVADAVGVAAQNAGHDDALSLRRFGGACDDRHNTVQVVGSGTGHGRRIGESAHKITPTGLATLHGGISAAIHDFSGRYPFRGRKINRIIVVTGHGTDACTHDQDALRRMIQQEVKAAKVRLDFRFVGYKTPAGERDGLARMASAAGAPAPRFVRTPADLTAALRRLVVPESHAAKKVDVPSASPSAEPARQVSLGRFTIAAPTTWQRIAPTYNPDLFDVRLPGKPTSGECVSVPSGDTSCPGFSVAYDKATMFLGARPFDVDKPVGTQFTQDGDNRDCPGHPNLVIDQDGGGARLMAQGHKPIGGRSAAYRQWRIDCYQRSGQGTGPAAGVSFTERVWYMSDPKVLIVDNWDTPDLEHILQKAVWK